MLVWRRVPWNRGRLPHPLEARRVRPNDHRLVQAEVGVLHFAATSSGNACVCVMILDTSWLHNSTSCHSLTEKVPEAIQPNTAVFQRAPKERHDRKKRFKNPVLVPDSTERTTVGPLTLLVYSKNQFRSSRGVLCVRYMESQCFWY